MKNNSSVVFAFVLVIGDFLALLAAFSVAYILRVKLDPRPLLDQIPAATYLKAFIVVLPLWILVHSFIGLYRQSVYEKRFSELGRLVIGSFLGILVVIGYDFVASDNIFPARLVAVYGLVLGFSFLVLFRTLARMLRVTLFNYGIGISNVLVIGDTHASKSIATALQDTRHTGQHVLGIVGMNLPGFRHYETFHSAIENIKDPIHSVIQTELYRDQSSNNEILKYTQERHVAYRFIPGNSDLFVGNIQVELFSGLPVVAVHQTALIGWGRILKRLFDLALGLPLLILALPFLLIICFIMILFDRGDPIFRQTRSSRFGSKINIYKFRTQLHAYNRMTPEEGFAKMGKPELAIKFRENGDFLENDPRISKIGRFLRKTSLDELPQLFNVLKGDLSLVGPRPLEPFEMDSFTKKNLVLSVKPGLTGLAVVSGRRDINFEERRKLDMYYSQNWSFWLDIIILLKTVRIVVNGRGAR